MTDELLVRIAEKWSVEQDTWQGDRGFIGQDAEMVFMYPPPDGFTPRKAGYNWRPLPEHIKEDAIRYIETLTVRYPLQLRGMLALPMWFRFIDVWSDTGKVHLAMRAI